MESEKGWTSEVTVLSTHEMIAICCKLKLHWWSRLPSRKEGIKDRDYERMVCVERCWEINTSQKWKVECALEKNYPSSREIMSFFKKKSGNESRKRMAVMWLWSLKILNIIVEETGFHTSRTGENGEREGIIENISGGLWCEKMWA